MKFAIIVVVAFFLLDSTSAKCQFTAKVSNQRQRCPEGWFKTNPWYSKCIRFESDAKCFGEATAFCKSLGGTLASITRDEEQSAVLSHLFIEKQVKDDVWIGGQRLTSNNGNSSMFLWQNGDVSPTGRFMLSTPWASGQLNKNGSPVSGTGNCVGILSIEHQEFGKWAAADCNLKRPFLCQREKLEPTPTFEISGGCSGLKTRNFVAYN